MRPAAARAPRRTRLLATTRIEASWPKADDEGRRWIDFQNDVTLKDVALAAREGYVSVEHLKRYTTLGMATDQGKTANVNAIAAMAALTGRTIDETGTTTYRPPFVPTPMGVIAGRRRGALLNPLRRLPLEAEHRADGAQMREYGGWLRPAWYGPDDPERAIQREAARARDSVALFDGSSLGKIEIIGPDAAALADFHSYNRLSTLKPGKIRYGFLLQESGVVFDDGVTLRLGEDRFLVSCSSGHTDAVRMRLELWRQDRFDARRVAIHDTTAQWATLTVTGPRSRDLIEACGLDVALDDQSLPHMAFAIGSVRRRPAPRSAGELHRRPLLRALGSGAPRRRVARAPRRRSCRRSAADCSGLEALMILRAEKGFIVVGKDTDGTTMPHDLGVTGPRDSRADEYIGKRSLFMPVANDPRRKQLVGLSVASGEAPLPTGAHVTAGAGRARRSQGYVTSSYYEPDARPPGRAWPRRSRTVAHGRNGRRLPSWRRAARDHHERRSRSIRKESGSMREMEWPPARGGAELLVDRPRLTARRLDGLGQTLISGDLDAAVASLAPGAPMLGLYALAPAGAHALRIGRTSALLVTPAPLGRCRTAGATAGARPASTTAGLRSRSRARTRRRRSCRRPRPISPRVHPRPPSLSLACAACSRETPSGFRVHVEAPWLETLLGWLDGV